jgi:hypothetical protein
MPLKPRHIKNPLVMHPTRRPPGERTNGKKPAPKKFTVELTLQQIWAFRFGRSDAHVFISENWRRCGCTGCGATGNDSVTLRHSRDCPWKAYQKAIKALPCHRCGSAEKGHRCPVKPNRLLQ